MSNILDILASDLDNITSNRSGFDERDLILLGDTNWAIVAIAFYELINKNGFLSTPDGVWEEIGRVWETDYISALENKNDIIVDGKKISGNAAKVMNKGVYLQHGTLVYDVDFGLMPGVLNIPEETAKDKIASLKQFRKISQNKVYEALKNNFIKDKQIIVGKLSNEEMDKAGELANTRYASAKLPDDFVLKNKGACYVLNGN